SACAYQTILTASVVTVLFNANPLMRYDGYFVATEVLRIQNLRQVANSELKRRAKAIFLGIEDNANSDLNGYVRAVALLYGVCSGIYMNLLMFSIAAMLAYKLPLVGILVAAYYINFSLNQKLGALQKYLFVSEEAKQAGMRARLVGVVAFVLVPLGLIFAPTPFRVSANGLLSVENEHQVRSLVEGTIAEVPVSLGESVTAETIVARLENSELNTALNTAQAEVTHARLVRKAMVDVDKVKYKQFTYVLARASDEMKDKTREHEALHVPAGMQGVVAHLPFKNSHGKFVHTGEPVATIVSGMSSIRCYLTESQMLQCFCEVGQPVLVSASGDSLVFYEGTIASIAPTAEGEFGDAALTQVGGGEILIDAETGRPLEPLFRIDIAPQDELARDLIGRRLLIRFEKKYEPLGWFVVRKLKDFISSVSVK
ncbi:MAG: hypothetical protein AAF483_09620, partial [Planctomycetota bacterium]